MTGESTYSTPAVSSVDSLNNSLHSSINSQIQYSTTSQQNLLQQPEQQQQHLEYQNNSSYSNASNNFNYNGEGGGEQSQFSQSRELTTYYEGSNTNFNQWSKHWDPNTSHYYYYNSQTQESTYERPTEYNSPRNGNGTYSDHTDESNLPYYEEDTNQYGSYNYSDPYYGQPTTTTTDQNAYTGNEYTSNPTSYGDTNEYTSYDYEGNNTAYYPSSSGSDATLYYETGNKTEFSYTDSNSTATTGFSQDSVEFPSYSFTLGDKGSSSSQATADPKKMTASYQSANSNLNIVE